MNASRFDARAYWEERLAGQFNSRGVGDIGMTGSYNDALYRVRSAVFRRCSRSLPLLPASSRVLDVGSGTGFYINEWLSWGAGTTTGSDITTVSVSNLRGGFPQCEFVRFDAGKPLPPELAAAQFDAVSCFDMLFHIVDDAQYRQAFENLGKLVRKGGWLLFSENLVGEQRDVGHQMMRTEDEILGLLAANGFRVRNRVPMFVLMNDPGRSRIEAGSPGLDLYIALPRVPLARLQAGCYFRSSLLAVRFVRNGPSTEVLVCERT